MYCCRLHRHERIIRIDVLPNDIAPSISAQMDQGVLAMQEMLGRSAA